MSRRHAWAGVLLWATLLHAPAFANHLETFSLALAGGGPCPVPAPASLAAGPQWQIPAAADRPGCNLPSPLPFTQNAGVGPGGSPPLLPVMDAEEEAARQAESPSVLLAVPVLLFGWLLIIGRQFPRAASQGWPVPPVTQ